MYFYLFLGKKSTCRALFDAVFLIIFRNVVACTVFLVQFCQKMAFLGKL